ncbi:hypothetical protein M2436_000310 [Streptomyces sp. HB372]|nr:hypothetical protein [Streptomyces sp. HB372]
MPTSPTDRKPSVPDFSDVPLTASAPPAGSAGEWQAAVTKAAEGAEAPALGDARGHHGQAALHR